MILMERAQVPNLSPACYIFIKIYFRYHVEFLVRRFQWVQILLFHLAKALCRAAAIASRLSPTAGSGICST